MLYMPDGDVSGVTTSPVAVAFIEYGAHKAQAERDTALGRWRSVAHPDFVVYPEVNGNWPVLWEADGRTRMLERDSFLPGDPRYIAQVLSEYFAAHPVAEPKPWEHANLGDVWVLTFSNGTHQAYAYGQSAFRNAIGQAIFMGNVTAGRRIFPEVTS